MSSSGGSSSSSSGGRSGSQAIERAMTVLDCFSGGAELTLTDVAARTGLAVSTTYRIIRALVRGGYLERDEADAYRIGRRLVGLVPRTALADEVSPHLYALAAGIKIAVSFGVAEDHELVTLVSARPPVRYCDSQIPADREPLHATAMGKVLLAFDPEGPASAIRRLGTRLKAYTGRTLTSPEVLCAQLGEARRRGFALSDEERTEGVRAVAVPVLTAGRQLAGAIGVQARSRRMTDDLVSSLVPALHHFAGEVSRRLQDDQLVTV